MPAKRRLTLEKIQAADDLKTEDFEVEEWGGWIKVRGLSRGEVGEMSERFKVDDPQNIDFETVQGMEEFLIASAVVDPEFDEEAAASLKAKNMKPVQRITRRIQELSGLLDGASLERDVDVALGDLADLDGEDMSPRAAKILQGVIERLSQHSEQRVEVAARRAFPSD